MSHEMFTISASPSVDKPFGLIDRRQLIGGIGGTFVCAVAGATAPVPFGGPAFDAAMARLERASCGRLGVAVRDLATGRAAAWRGDERFPMCSTFKLLLAAVILHRVDRGQERLDRRLPIARGDLLETSPFTETRVGQDATIAELCEAAVTRSDNAAANLLLGIVDGPAGVTGFLRATGDPVTRLDRWEPALNTAIPGDPRDTSSPHAMLATLDRLLLGTTLRPASRRRLVRWMVANRTGDERLRAGVPTAWRIGDKTGTGVNGTSNDLAVLWPPERAPILVASFLTGAQSEGVARNLILKQIGLAVTAAVTG